MWTVRPVACVASPDDAAARDVQLTPEAHADCDAHGFSAAEVQEARATGQPERSFGAGWVTVRGTAGDRDVLMLCGPDPLTVCLVRPH